MSYSRGVKKLSFMLLFAFVIGSISCNSTEEDKNVNVKTRPGEVFISRKGVDVKLPLYNADYIGTLKGDGANSYLIVSGKTCNECDENAAVYLVPVAQDKEALKLKYSYPGKVFDYETRSIVFESEMFYGDCFPNKKECVFWLQKEYDGGKMRKSVFVVEVVNDSIVETRLTDTSVFNSLINNKCKKVEGIDVTSEP